MNKKEKPFIGFVVPPEPPPRKISYPEGMLRYHLDITPHERRDYARLASIISKFVIEPDPEHPVQ